MEQNTDLQNATTGQPAVDGTGNNATNTQAPGTNPPEAGSSQAAGAAPDADAAAPTSAKGARKPSGKAAKAGAGTDSEDPQNATTGQPAVEFPREMLLVNDTARTWVVRKHVQASSSVRIEVRDADDLVRLNGDCYALMSTTDHYKPVEPKEGEDAKPLALRIEEIPAEAE